MSAVIDRKILVMLTEAPTWALEHELMRRSGKIGPDPVEVGDLRVDPVASGLEWRGERYEIRGRCLEIVYALATARARGRRRVPTEWLVSQVFRGMAFRDGRNNLIVQLARIKRWCPGLVLTSGRGPQLGYGLNVDEKAEAVA